jgi:hypothetical protein
MCVRTAAIVCANAASGPSRAPIVAIDLRPAGGEPVQKTGPKDRPLRFESGRSL